MDSFNKNDRQVYFNQVKGTLAELNNGDRFCSITLNVGHESKRQVNFVTKKPQYDKIVEAFKIGDKLAVKFYVTSVKKNGRWYTMANALSVDKDDFNLNP